MAEKTFPPLSARTDANGYFSVTWKEDPPGFAWIEKRVHIWMTLLEPPGTSVHGTLDIDATDGTPSNQEKNFTAQSGQETSLGQWDLSLGETIVVVRGRTIPPAIDTALRVEVKAQW